MRQLNGHKVNPANDKLTVEVLDGGGPGGASHVYRISGFNTETNPSMPGNVVDVVLAFQNGPIGDVGVNGITHEALIAILIDRLQAFQDGPYKCRENAIALTKLQEVQMWLLERTRSPWPGSTASAAACRCAR